MYFSTGWPKVLRSSGATSGRPVKLFRHRTKNFVIELRERSVAFWHTRLGVLVSSYIRSAECVEKYGVNNHATLKPDGSTIVIATSKGHLLFLRVNYEKLLPSNQLPYVTREHGILLQHSSHFEVTGDGVEVEGVTMKYFYETAVIGGVISLFCVGGQLVVATGYGVLHRVNWEGKFDSSLAIHINQVPLANDLLPESRGQPLGEVEVCLGDVVYSPELHGFSIVMGDGKAVFISAKSAKYEPQSLQGVWIKGLTDAVCTAVNVKYRLLAFGRENGAVDVFSVDDLAGTWNLSHTLQFTKRQFPETGVQLGAVRCIQWSHNDGMVIAVSWENGGLSLWSVFGSLLLCSLGDQPGTPSPLNPHCTILESLCWSLDGYHLWMLPIDTKTKHRLEGEGNGCGQEESTNKMKTSTGCHDNNGQVLVMRFLKNSIVNNPVTSNHNHLFLQGSDRLYLNSSKSVVSSGNHGNHGNQERGVATDNVSSPQWKVLQLPSSYLVMNWPVKYVAVSPSGVNIAVAGKAGFALYSGFKRKWKLFGNEIQEQSLVCRGGLLWYRDIVVFPCRVQERSEEVRFYSLYSNLDNSQLMQTITLTSPVVKVNLHGNHLLLASRDCHMTIYSLNITVLPNQGPVLSVVKLHEMSLVKSLPQPWANTLVSMVPSNIRTEPTGGQKDRHRPVDSVFFNISGRLLMIQQDLPNPYLQHQEEWSFNLPVCVAQAVEILWTPSPLPPTRTHPEDHLKESLWLACGSSGIKVWLPLYPRDEGHPTFLSKRIMLTLPITVYPQAVLFHDAVLFGLSHETAFTETSFLPKYSFPFATTERTTHVFLHHILRQLLRRNLGSHALQIARSCSYLPYFAHVLELMLHEVLEEEAPGAMPVPDALLPRVVEFIKQFPEFLETVGSCARKTEVALWQYLFAAVGNPRDLFELCISDGRLKTAASYLIIIQNLEASTVSRQLATRLLDAALDNNQWELCKDLVRFLRAIGPGDIDSPSPLSSIAPATPLKTPTPTSSITTAATSVGMSPLLAAPDLDRSAMSIARDHLSSGSVSSVVSLSGGFRDASGKVIRRPQFVMDVDSREEYFIELILSRHARKLLTARCLQDLGKFAAHLDFNLHTWLARERLRAARVEDFVATLRELHKQFQWPFPSFLPNTKPLTKLHEDLETPLLDREDTRKDETSGLFSPGEQSSKGTVTPMAPTSPGSENPGDSPSDSASVASSSLKRAKRPPNLELSPDQNMVDLAPDVTQSVAMATENMIATMETTSDERSGSGSVNVTSRGSFINRKKGVQGEFDPTQCSTPSRRSGSISERISLEFKKHPSSSDLQVDASSLGDIMEESDWDLGPEVSMTMTLGMKGSAQAEKEIRYFIEVTLEALCIEWAIVLGVLLLDVSVLARIVETVQKQGGVEGDVFTRVVQGMEEMYTWAESECPGYLHFLDSIHPHFDQLKSLAQHSPKTPLSQSTEETDVGVSLAEDSTTPLQDKDKPSPKVAGTQDPNASVCVVS